MIPIAIGILDENLPRQLKSGFGPEYVVKTVRDMGWLGKMNGELWVLLFLMASIFSSRLTNICVISKTLTGLI